MADDTADNQPKGLPAHLRDDLKWKKGQSGNPGGRPKGARVRLGEDFCQALMDDFANDGIAAIQAMRRDRPNEYAKMIAGLLPKEITGEDGGDIVVAQTIKLIGVEPDGD